MKVLTVGYGNQSWERTLARLTAHSVTHLVDVRTNPFSRHSPDFRRDTLRSLAEAAGLAYVFLGRELGGKPNDPALQTDGRPDYEKIRASSVFAEGVAVLEGLPGVPCLLCGCLSPDSCHRGRLVTPVLVERGHEVWHIMGDGTVLPHGHKEQGQLF
ncbi:MAG: DUF488 domain-containing protein [Fimbriimonadaceae bacterium]|nr:DUF488 domain-containing protein [Fimbriimonadaceae bacterium]QYK55918.1 MAG: DUF488 domain-containing protein [Fimbriimonadaceae bacterium]